MGVKVTDLKNPNSNILATILGDGKNDGKKQLHYHIFHIDLDVVFTYICYIVSFHYLR